MFVIHAPRRPVLDARVLVFPVIAGLALAAIFLRLWYLQVVKGDELSERARFFRNTAVSRPAPRGIVFDRKGRVLAGVRSVYVVTAIPAIVRKNDWVLGKIAEMLGTDEQKLADRVKDAAWRPYLPATIMVNVGVQIASRIAELGADLPGIGIESQPMRTYPDPKTFAHVLGYVWTPNENDVARLADLDVKPAAYVGKLGIEYVYEKDLMGAAGQERLEVDAKRRPVRLVGRDNAVPGAQAILSIDAELQRLAVEQLGGRPGAVVAIDPNNGEVLCLASSPTYDASLFDGGISHADWERLSDNPDRPLLNRAASASYAPGSAFKLVVSLAAMRKGTFDPNRTFYCPGYYTVGNRKSKCLGQHGSISYHEALTKSCNTYFSDLAVRTGADAIRDEAIACGFNSQTLVDLRSESRGLVPTEEWIDKHRKPPQWYAGDTVNLGIGQGELRATPLQMANLVALVATRGRQYQPHLMHALRRPGAPAELTQPAMLHQVDAPEAFWDELTSAMADVIDRGTAVRAKIPGLRWAGKTGSAEHKHEKKTHSWFIGFAPLDHPRIAIAVLAEEAGHGGDVAAPVAAAVVRHYLRLDASTKAAAKSAAAASAVEASAARPSLR